MHLMYIYIAHIGDNNLHLNIMAEIKVSEQFSHSEEELSLKTNKYINKHNVNKFILIVQKVINKHVYELTKHVQGNNYK